MQAAFEASKPSMQNIYKPDNDDFMVLMLTKDNYSMWLVDIRARLRKKELWKYTQEIYQPSIVKEEDEALTDEQIAQIAHEKQSWAENAMKAADEMTPRISLEVKQMLDDSHYNDGLLMMKRLEELLQPMRDAQFITLTRELYSLKAVDFSSMTDFLKHVNVLDEKILATRVQLTRDKQLIICMMMALPEAYHSLSQTWSMMPNLTAEQARYQLLEEEKRQQNRKHEQSTAEQPRYQLREEEKRQADRSLERFTAYRLREEEKLKQNRKHERSTAEQPRYQLREEEKRQADRSLERFTAYRLREEEKLKQNRKHEGSKANTRRGGHGGGGKCPHCHRNMHPEAECWDLHPELEPEWSQKKKQKMNDGSVGASASNHAISSGP